MKIEFIPIQIIELQEQFLYHMHLVEQIRAAPFPPGHYGAHARHSSVAGEFCFRFGTLEALDSLHLRIYKQSKYVWWHVLVGYLAVGRAIAFVA
mgnify:CR=1 FL=1